MVRRLSRLLPFLFGFLMIGTAGVNAAGPGPQQVRAASDDAALKLWYDAPADLRSGWTQRCACNEPARTLSGRCAELCCVPR